MPVTAPYQVSLSVELELVVPGTAGLNLVEWRRKVPASLVGPSTSMSSE